MARIDFDNRKELFVWGVIWMLLGLMTNLMSENSDYLIIGVVSIFLWTGLGKYGVKFILDLFYRIQSKNKKSLGLTLNFIIFKYRVSKMFSGFFKK